MISYSITALSLYAYPSKYTEHDLYHVQFCSQLLIFSENEKYSSKIFPT